MDDKTPAPYEGLARVTEIVGEIFGGPPDNWIGLCKPTQQRIECEWNAPTEEEILKWSSEMGTRMHEECLEDKKHLEVTKEQLRAKKFYQEWLDEYKPQRIGVEQECCHPDSLYGGTIDMLCRINGERYIVDLKFFGWWKEHFGYEQSKEVFPAAKAAKVNLQTGLYNLTQKRDHKRACLIIHPDGWMFHEFQRDSKYLEKACEIAKTVSRRSEKYLLADF